MSVRVADLRLSGEQPSLLVAGVRQKTGKYAERPLHSTTAAVLHRTLAAAPDRELVWPWVKDRKFLFTLGAELFSRAGIVIARKVFHLMRRTAATQIAILYDVDKARQYLQHESVSTTLKHYIDGDQLDPIMRRMSDVLPRPEMGGAT